MYPASIPTHYLALNITISGYGDNLGFGFIACRRSVPALQRMLDYTDSSIQELEAALNISSSINTTITTAAPSTRTKKGAAKHSA